jgi:acyl carrier protein
MLTTVMPAATLTFDDVLERLRSVLHETFEIDPAKVTPEANLFTDLEMDSIDAIDLAIQVQSMTGIRIKPDDFKSVRTVGDVVATVLRLVAG